MQLLEDIKITELKGIGEKKALAFKKLGVSSLYDLLYYFPRRYEDRTGFKNIADISDGESACICAVVADTPTLSRIRKGLELVKFRVYDETGSVNITFFNQAYIKNNISRGDLLNIYGKFTKSGNHCSLTNPVYEPAGSHNKCGIIKPVYGLSSGLTQNNVSDSVSRCLSMYRYAIEDIIPRSLSEKYGLISAAEALSKIHFPTSFEDILASRKRMVFEELLVFTCALEKMREGSSPKKGIVIDSQFNRDFLVSLPFSPTNAQSKAIDDCLKDMGSGKAMRRLLQGDVGSGKTLVAAAAIFSAIKSGYCAAFMAPTEILAQQHFSTFKKFFKAFDFKTELLTGSTPAAERRAILNALKSGDIDLVIGTHALFSDDVEYSRLALVVTDEQHRFGVRQRSALIDKASQPHVLVMSATPIPRTLSLIMYGDLDISVIDELPPGRQTVDTFLVDSSYHERINKFLLKHINEGHRVFVVCPKVEDDEEGKLKSALEYANTLSSELPGVRVGCIHGKMSSREKDSVMDSFISGNIDILTATTVIEVGVDVPDATVMVIENADRFGLSQLHQLRGRVGRGIDKSYCILVSDTDSDTATERMKMLCSTNDGFKIAEYDLKTRGPGEILGSRQHGLPELQNVDFASELNLIKEVQQEASLICREDPSMSSEEYLLLRNRVERFCNISTAALN